LLQFAAALVLFVAILVGSYWFVYAPSRRRKDSDDNEG
jgi:cbb3-type cytochrome oxidase subunit 3